MSSSSGGFEGLESFVRLLMRRYGTPAVSVAVVKGGRVAYARGFGYRDVASLLPATPRTIYGIGSITKSFTALAVLKLVERGLASLDDPVEKYVKGVNLAHHGARVTLHHLLTHTSGIPALGYAEALIYGIVPPGVKPPYPVVTPDDVVSFLRGATSWADAPPGKTFSYLNEGYVLLGKVVEAASGRRYEDFVRDEILKPLGMSRSYFSRGEVEADGDVATPYAFGKGGELIKCVFPYGISADGGLLSNVLDLSKYLMMLINYGRLGEAEVVGRRSVELMEEPHVRLGMEVFGGEEYYGYGLMIHKDFLGRTLVGHGGSVLMYNAYVGYVREEGVAVAVLTNSPGVPPLTIAAYALAEAMGEDPRRVKQVLAELVAGSVEGLYESYGGTMKARVRRRGGYLVIEWVDAPEEPIVALIEEVRPDGFKAVAAGSYMNRVPIEVSIEGGKAVLRIERYKLVRVGGVPQA